MSSHDLQLGQNEGDTMAERIKGSYGLRYTRMGDGAIKIETVRIIDDPTPEQLAALPDCWPAWLSTLMENHP